MLKREDFKISLDGVSDVGSNFGTFVDSIQYNGGSYTAYYKNYQYAFNLPDDVDNGVMHSRLNTIAILTSNSKDNICMLGLQVAGDGMYKLIQAFY